MAIHFDFGDDSSSFWTCAFSYPSSFCVSCPSSFVPCGVVFLKSVFAGRRSSRMPRTRTTNEMTSRWRGCHGCGYGRVGACLPDVLWAIDRGIDVDYCPCSFFDGPRGGHRRPEDWRSCYGFVSSHHDRGGGDARDP